MTLSVVGGNFARLLGLDDTDSYRNYVHPPVPGRAKISVPYRVRVGFTSRQVLLEMHLQSQLRSTFNYGVYN